MLAELQESFVANTNDGLVSARACGRVSGRRPKLTADQAVQQIADMFNVPRSRVYGHLGKTKSVQPKETATAKP